MIERRIDDITRADIRQLIDDAVCERRTLEYKAALPDNTDAAKREFLADVSSFANTDGGDIVFGVAERRDADGRPTGVPEAIHGLDGVNADATVLRLEQMIRQGIAPAIQAIQVKVLAGLDGGPIVVLRIGRSALRPHMVTFKNRSRFYRRTSAGKSQLDVMEIRSAMLATEDLPRRMRAFRDERLAMILSGQTPIQLYDSAKLVVHVVPYVSMSPGTSIDPLTVKRARAQIRPIGGPGYPRFNVDGFLTFSPPSSGLASDAYAQVFRNGVIEYVECGFVVSREERRLVASIAYEEEFMERAREMFALFAELDLRPPAAIFVTLLGVQGATMLVSGFHYRAPESHGFDRDVVRVPEIVVQDYEGEMGATLRPLFDAIWQAAGFAGSLNYDEHGRWARQRR